MRLVKQVDRMEAAAAAPVAGGVTVWLVWTQHESRVDAAELEPGQWIAADVLFESPRGDRFPPRCGIVERVTGDERDLGWVLDGAGRRVGHVVQIDGDRVVWRFFKGGDGYADMGYRDPGPRADG